MIMDASSKIAVRCSECGKYNLFEMNLFHLKMQTSIRCKCGHRMLKAQVDRRQLVLDVDCIACDKQHLYKFRLSDIMGKATKIISCPDTGIEIAFLGKDDYIDEIVERYLSEMEEVFRSFGFVSHLSQTVGR